MSETMNEQEREDFSDEVADKVLGAFRTNQNDGQIGMVPMVPNPGFPCSYKNCDNSFYENEGQKHCHECRHARLEIARVAMQGFIIRLTDSGMRETQCDHLAKDSYEMADAMMEAR